ncbi:hypothetical protein OIU78_011357 [Salix suchowensis]|nr:hypothetical protein OIU78_011357 [Salix suchowensis]
MSSTYLYFAFFMSLALVAAFASATDHGGYGPHPDPNLVKPSLNKEKTLSAMIGVQGLVYCRSGRKRFPLQGAVVRITCLASDGSGYEAAPFSFLSEATDAKGYFFATLSPYEMQESKIGRLKSARLFLINHHWRPATSLLMRSRESQGLFSLLTTTLVIRK